MMSLILNFGLRYWKYIALVIVIAGLFFYWKHRSDTIKEQGEEIVQLKADVALKIAELESIKKAVELQNTEIENLKKRGKVAVKNIEKANAHAQAISANYAAEIARILNEKGPQTCPESIKYLIDGAKELNK